MPIKTVIENTQNKPISLQLKKIWEHRALLWVFAMRDVKVQYTQTRLGIVWSFIQAITAAFIINLFFGVLMQVETQGVPYILFAFPGLMAWYYFSFIISNAGQSLVHAQQIIKKVYFPKLILPLSKSIVGLVDFLIWFILLLILFAFYAYPLKLNIILIPFCVLLNMIAGLSIAIWLSALTVKYRDVFHIIPYVIGFGIFVTPVFFEAAMIPAGLDYLIYFNPMAGVIAFYRWCLFDTFISIKYLLGIVPVVILFITGIFYFRKVESIMTDLI